MKLKLPMWELAKYFGVGLVATAVDYVSYIPMTRLFGLSALTANPLSYIFGNFVSFAGHHFITFRSSGRALPEYARFAAVTAGGLAVSQITVALALMAGIHDLYSKAAAVLVSGAFNYLCNRYWTFRKTR